MNSALEKINGLKREMESVQKDQDERERLKQQSDASLQRLHRLVGKLTAPTQAESSDTDS